LEVDEVGENVVVVADFTPTVYKIDNLAKISQFGGHDHNMIVSIPRFFFVGKEFE
jgi:hypothetical protein